MSSNKDPVQPKINGSIIFLKKPKCEKKRRYPTSNIVYYVTLSKLLNISEPVSLICKVGWSLLTLRFYVL